MANIDTTQFKLDSLDSLIPKISYFNNYMTEFSQISASLAGASAISGVGGAGAAAAALGKVIDLPLGLRLIMFTAKHIEGIPFLPAIILPVNPDSFIARHKKRSDVIYTLGGFIVNHWHDDVIVV